MLDTPIARIENLRVEFETKDGTVVGVEDVSFEINAGETVCIVGESGSGKSVSSLSLMRLIEYGGGTITGGRMLFDRREGGEIDLAQTEQGLMRTIRGNEIGMIFQEPMTALNPVFTVGRQLSEGLQVHRGMTRKEARARALELLREVRIPEPERRLDQYPHELSGGMRQRILIASAFAAEPKLIIADEPTTALDVTVQKQILKLIAALQREHGTALLFVTHDLGVVSKVCDTLSVLYGGKVVETANMRRFFTRPIHPYSRALLAATPTYTNPTGSLTPVPAQVIADVDAEVLDHDRRHPA